MATTTIRANPGCPDCWGEGVTDDGEPCGPCADAATVALLGSGWLSHITARLLDTLETEGGIADPLAETFTLSSILADLFTLADAPLPPIVAARIG